MEELDSSSISHVSFLSLLMAPDDDNITPPDHHIYHNTPHFNNNNHHLLPFPFSSSSSSSSSFDVTNNITYDQQFPTFSDYHHHNYMMHQNYSSFDDANNTHFLPPLPDLYSLENTTPPSALAPLLPQHPAPEQKDDFTLNSILANFQSSSLKNKQPKQQPKRRNNRPPRNRQSKLSEKVYNLGKLLPGGHRHRKRTADMLEEAHKYIKFLQAQVSVLNSMPNHDLSSSLLLPTTTQHITNGGGGGGGGGQSRALAILAMLSRQQLLQVVLNSPAAQVVMADNEWCLFSAEQVALIKRAQARHKIIQQLLTSLPL